jgi:hypothetical protein
VAIGLFLDPVGVAMAQAPALACGPDSLLDCDSLVIMVTPESVVIGSGLEHTTWSKIKDLLGGGNGIDDSGESLENEGAVQ